MDKALRVAFFPDSYLEVNGAAMTCRRLTDFAKKNDFPMLVIHAGKETKTWDEGSVRQMRLKRSPVSFSLDEELAYDPLFQRHTNKVLKALMEFQPDVIHITGLNDVSIIGAYLAWKLQMPLLGSWHTNVHEFAAQRLRRMMRFLPQGLTNSISGFAEKKILDGTVLYYKMPKVVLAPNQELIDLLGNGTHRKALFMGRGVDADYFSPSKRTVNDGIFRIGFVGRLRAEKNVRIFVDLEKKLIEKGKSNFRFLIVGEGNERDHLQRNLKNAEFTGFLSGEPLAEAYANMDAFVFASETDAFGNVAQEAAASGVVPIVSDKGGPKYLVTHGESGFVAANLDEFRDRVIELMDDPKKLEKMRTQARASAENRSWDAIFQSVYEAYRETIRLEEEKKRSLENSSPEAA